MAMLPDPFGTFLQFQQALDALRASSWLESSISGGGTFPPLNVFRKGDDIVILTELPGIRKADLQIQVKGRTIRLAGAKPVEYGEKASLHRRERLAGSFDRGDPPASSRKRARNWRAPARPASSSMTALFGRSSPRAPMARNVSSFFSATCPASHVF